MSLSSDARERFRDLVQVIMDCPDDMVEELTERGIVDKVSETHRMLATLEAYEETEGVHGPNTQETLNILWVLSKQIRQMLQDYADEDA